MESAKNMEKNACFFVFSSLEEKYKYEIRIIIVFKNGVKEKLLKPVSDEPINITNINDINEMAIKSNLRFFLIKININSIASIRAVSDHTKYVLPRYVNGIDKNANPSRTITDLSSKKRIFVLSDRNFIINYSFYFF